MAKLELLRLEINNLENKKNCKSTECKNINLKKKS